MTTTNGTRALRACAHARKTLVSSFLNLGATKDTLRGEAPARLVLVCSGTYEQAAYEDALWAGALCDLLWNQVDESGVSDSALIARKLFRQERHDLLAAVSQSRNGRRLLSHAELREDVRYCVQRDALSAVPEMNGDGRVISADLAL
jgi:2-phosphosulfolactate phosphatase